MPIFEVVNYTYYNTDDLLKIFDHVESAVEAHRGAILPNFARRWCSEGERLPLHVTFKDYTPSSYVKESNNWNTGKKVTAIERVYVKECSHPSTDIRVVPPDHVWDTPLEALAAARSEDRCVPSAMLDSMIQRVGNLYDVNRWGQGDNYSDPPAKGLILRIESAPPNKIDKEERARAARQRAMSSLDEALYAIPKISQYAENLQSSVQRATQHLRRSKVPLGDKEVAMEEAVSYIMEAVVVAEQAIRAAKVGR